MKITKLLLISILIGANSFVFAQSDDDCEEYEIVDTYEFDTRKYKDLDVSISYRLGELTIGSSESKNTIEGSITYDSNRIDPEVTMGSIGTSGVLTIQSKKDKENDPCRKYKLRDFENEMEFYFPSQIKTDLFLDFGVGDAFIDLTDISVTKLDVNCGLSDVEIEINDRNNVKCNTVNIESGLGDLSIMGLGNLGADEIDINVGLGSADIDFSGDRLYDTDINVDVGLGSLDIVLPNDINIKVNVDASFLSSVDIYGLKKKKNDLWVSPNWDSSDPTFSVDVNVGMGSIDIVVDD